MPDTAPTAECPDCGSDNTDFVEEYSDGTILFQCLSCDMEFEQEPEGLDTEEE